MPAALLRQSATQKGATNKKATKGRAATGRKKPLDPKKAFAGRWRIVQMEAWDEDYFEMDGPAFIELERRGFRSFKFGLVEGQIDCRFHIEGADPVMEFSWEGRDENDAACGRGRAFVDASGELRGRIFIHLGEESDFVAKRMKSRSPGSLAHVMVDRVIPSEYRGWWRITETSTWVDDGLDALGTALLSIGTGRGDRLRMHCLLAYVNCKATKAGVSFTWEGAWEFDQMSGSGHVTLGKDGRLRGKIRIKQGDHSDFAAVRAEEPEEPIPNPPRYRDKWRRR